MPDLGEDFALPQPVLETVWAPSEEDMLAAQHDLERANRGDDPLHPMDDNNEHPAPTKSKRKVHVHIHKD